MFWDELTLYVHPSYDMIAVVNKACYLLLTLKPKTYDTNNLQQR
jgi:hypothetical protein